MKTLVKTLIFGSMLMASGNLCAQPYLISDSQDFELPVFGTNNNGTNHDLHCPPGHTIAKIDIITGADHVKGVRFGCMDFLEDGSLGYSLIMQDGLGHPEYFGDDGGTYNNRRCAPDLWTGIHGRTSSKVDQLGVYCGDIDDVMAGRNGITYSAVGGSGGTSNESECPAGYLVTGAKVTVRDSGDRIKGIELICGRVYEPGGPPLVGQLGILDVTANGGINPATGAAWQSGDQYRLAFVSSQGRSAGDKKISRYNRFVKNLAHDAGHLVDWRVIGSTASVTARDNTSTNPMEDGNGVAIFAMDGRTKIADDYVDLWDGKVDAHITLDENGNSKFGKVLGGSSNDGTQCVDGRVLGGSSESPSKVTTGNTNKGAKRWIVHSDSAATNSLSVYALSELLTVESAPDEAPVIYFTPHVDAATVERGSAVSYPAVACFDDYDPRPVISEGAAVDTDQAGLHTRTYTCQDSAGNTQSKDFKVWVYEGGDGVRVDELYTNITGRLLSADEVETIAYYSDRFESGELTCTDLVHEFISFDDLGSPEPFYIECETDESRRSGELMAAICPDGLYDNCPLTKEYGQFVSVSDDSLSVNIDRGVLWWRFWTGVGATVTANDAKCLDPDDRDSEINCFAEGEPNKDAIHAIVTPDLSAAVDLGLVGTGFGLYFVPKLFEYYTWYYTHNQRCRVYNDLCTVDRPGGADDSRPGYTPVLFPPNFSLGDAIADGVRVDAISMQEKSCWQGFDDGDSWLDDDSCYAGLQNSIHTPHQVKIRGVRFSDDETDWEWGFYTDNQYKHMMTIYDGSNHGFASDFGINLCHLDMGNGDFNNYVTEGLGDPITVAANFDPDYYCTFTEDEYKNLLETKLSLDAQEREGIAQAFFDSFFGVAVNMASLGTGAAAKSAAAGARLAKILKAVGNTIDGIDEALELASLAAEVYVFATEGIQECMDENDGPDRTACFFQATAPTLIGLAGDRFISDVAGGDLLDTLTKKVPEANADPLSVGICLPTGGSAVDELHMRRQCRRAKNIFRYLERI